jgi:hypothetical protein
MNPLPARYMSTEERLREICRLLALGLVRLHQRGLQTTSQSLDDNGDFPLDCPARQSGHAPDPNGAGS